MTTVNPYRNLNSVALSLSGSHDFELLDITSDHAFTRPPRGLYVNNTSGSAQVLMCNASGSNADVPFNIEVSGVYELSPAVIKANNDLTVIALY